MECVLSLVEFEGGFNGTYPSQRETQTNSYDCSILFLTSTRQLITILHGPELILVLNLVRAKGNLTYVDESSTLERFFKSKQKGCPTFAQFPKICSHPRFTQYKKLALDERWLQENCSTYRCFMLYGVYVIYFLSCHPRTLQTKTQTCQILSTRGKASMVLKVQFDS